MTDTPRQRKSARRYLGDLAGAMLLYAGVLASSIWWVNANPEATARWIVGLLPMGPVLLVALAILRFFQRMDELARRQLTEALAFAFASSALFVLSLGFLQVAGLPRLSVWWIWVGMVVLWIVGAMVTALRYR
jgi:O-antigen/teichoic acid export membrane protein